MDKLVFAHYFTPYPISLDNKDGASDYYANGYLNPNGESGKHAAYGGLLRDRPIPRAPLTASDWETADLATEVNQAIAGGLDGFTVDLLSLDLSTSQIPMSGNRNARLVKKLLAVASSVGFKIMLMPDISSLAAKSPVDVATMCKNLGAFSSAFRLPDGRLVISPFKAEGWTTAQWQTFIDQMGGPNAVALVPCFLNYSSNVSAFKSALGSAMYGASNWGNRNPAGNGVSTNVARIADCHSRGLAWMQPVSIQDERPNQGIYDEAGNTENLRLTWQAAIDGGADWVQIPTWNDYSEGASIAPSVHHGNAFLDISRFYADWFRTGSQPAITKDRIFLTHRQQFVADTPSFPQTKLMKLRGGSSPARDEVEALVFLTSPADVVLSSGATTKTVACPAGVSVVSMPLAVGQQSAKIVRMV